MKATFVMRPDANLIRGGAELMVERTAIEMERLGVSVEVLTPLTREFGDIVHFFGSYESHWSTATLAMQRGTPYVATPIFSSSRTDAQERRRGARQRLTGRFPRLEKKLLQHASRVIVATRREARRIEAYYGLQGLSFEFVPLGVDARFASGNPEIFRAQYGILGPFVLHSGAYGTTKNQLNVTRALKGTGTKVVFVGSNLDRAYRTRCEAEADDRALFLDPVEHDSDMLASLYAAADVLCLPSYNETFSLAALEALVAGCRVILGNRWEADELYGEDGTYVDPDDVCGIRNAVATALQQGRQDQAVSAAYLQRFSWPELTARVKAVYDAVLGKTTMGGQLP